MKSALVLLAAAAVAGSFAACKDDETAVVTPEDAGTAPAPFTPEQVARGKYLVDSVFVCGGCHTPRLLGISDTKRYLAGEECMYGAPLEGASPDGGTEAEAEAGAGDAGDGGASKDGGDGGEGGDAGPPPGASTIGCLNSRNLTNDPTGLKNYSNAEIKNMFLNGVRPNGEYLDPVMPYWQFHAMTDADADAIVAYLRTVPGYDHRDKPSEAPWFPVPTPARPLALDKLYAPPPSSPTYDAQMRGRYLAALACVGCHTPDSYERGQLASAPSPIDESRLFAGGAVFAASLFHFPTTIFPAKIYAQNLTQDATGLAGYSVQNVLDELKLGKAKDGSNVCPPMPAGRQGFEGLTDQDANDIAQYILSLPPISNKRPEDCKL